MIQINIRLFGQYQTSVNNEIITRYRSNKVQALLAFLIAEHAQYHSRAALMTLLWPNTPQKSAQTNLRKTLSRLRGLLPDSVLSEGRTIQINRAAVSADTLTFDRLLKETTEHPHPNLQACPDCLARLEQLVDLYKGPFLHDFSLPDSAEFELWAAGRREQYQQRFLEAVGMLTDVRLGQQDFDSAETLARQQLNLDLLQENAHRQLMQALALGGKRNQALTQYDQLRQLLWDELGVAPTSATLTLLEQIETDALGNAVAIGTTRTILPLVQHNLPVRPTLFIGRIREITELDALISNADNRLISIVGPGGMGKTRLAQAVGKQQLNKTLFPDGVFFVALDVVDSAENIPAAIAKAVSFELDSAPPDVQAKRLIGYLQKKQLLLIFDNFEHLLEGATLVRELLAQAENITVLATTRERLRLQGEHVYALFGLDHNSDQSEAVALFTQCAQRLQPNWTVSKNDQRAIGKICEQVAGTPLALELAAGWIDMLSLDEIVSELQSSLDLLETEMRDVSVRHRSMRAVWDGTWGRLDSAEKTIFSKLSIFQSDFGRDAATEITGASLRQLAALTSKSLLYFNRSVGRYTLHALLRQFGEEKLKHSDQLVATQKAYQDYYLNFVYEREADIQGRRQIPAFTEISAELDNIRRAWQWAAAQKNYHAIEIAVDPLICYFDAMSLWNLGVELQQQALIGLQPPSGQTPHRTWYRVVSRRLRPRENELPIIKEALAFAKKNNDKSEIAQCYIMLGWALQATGDAEGGLLVLEKAHTLYFEIGEKFKIARVIQMLADINFNSMQFKQAYEAFQQSLPIFKEIGDIAFASRIYFRMGRIAFFMSHFTECEKHYTEASRRMRLIGHNQAADSMALMLVDFAIFRGEFDRARAVAREGLARIGSIDDVGDSVRDYRGTQGTIASINGDYSSANQLFNAYRATLPPYYLGYLGSHFTVAWHLAIINWALGDIGAFKQELKTALSLTFNNHNIKGHALMVYPVAALILAYNGKSIKAVELMALSSHHLGEFGGWIRCWEPFIQLRAKLEANCSAEQFAQAWQRGQTLDIWEVGDGLMKYDWA